jgi:aminoglycoside phosphotransferase family enzyme/predicted kinase
VTSAARSTVEPDEVRSALAKLASLPAADVSVRETHISWVFLAGERAYKLKKALALPFLDYTTAARRRRMCIEEVRLNRRLAPTIYLGVRALVRTQHGLELAPESDPRAVEHIVEMRRFDEQHTLAAMLNRGELRHEVLEGVGRTLAEFHAGCLPAPSGRYGARAVAHEVRRNIEELVQVTELLAELALIKSLSRFTAAFIAAHSGTLQARADRGCTREVHGDLRAEHVVLEPGVSIVDCVEFDAELRTLDVADDLAFLVMDMAALGGERYVADLVTAYRRAGGDCGGDPLLAFFSVHRALVRAKVLLVRAAQHPPGSSAHGHASARARDLLTLAKRLTWRARLPLVIVLCGVPASGKSHLAAALAAESGLRRLSSDVVRKQLAGLAPTSRAAPTDYYNVEANHATYAELGRLSAAEVVRSGGAIVDATFRHRDDRDAFAASFAGAAPLLFAECTAPPDVLAERAIERERDPLRASDATLRVVLREQSAWEPLNEVATNARIELDTNRPAQAILEDLVAGLDERI